MLFKIHSISDDNTLGGIHYVCKEYLCMQFYCLTQTLNIIMRIWRDAYICLLMGMFILFLLLTRFTDANYYLAGISGAIIFFSCSYVTY